MKKKELEKLQEMLASLIESTQDTLEAIEEAQFLRYKLLNILTQLYIEDLYKREIAKLRIEALKYKRE